MKTFKLTVQLSVLLIIFLAPSFYVFQYLDLHMTGSRSWKMFAAPTALAVVCLFLNQKTFEHISTVHNTGNLGLQPAVQLNDIFNERWLIAKRRILTGFLLAFLNTIPMSYMYLKDEQLVDYIWLAAAADVLLWLIVVLLLSVYEYFQLSQFADDLVKESKLVQKKKEALLSLNGNSPDN